ncbi:MAG: ribosome biogenesis GTP-binding protein YihA/YsxC [Lachnospiraceae bacterium]|nr:ribosome biogenesis GTP-binding protein YihA/YsxC [Lachnospiraceae bacterium]
MKIKSVNLEKVVGITSTIPETDTMEIAFAGKSNVGKSSLINALMNRKKLAHVSERPGKTQTINYYRVNKGVADAPDFAPDCYLVDLPGYGYAKTAISEKEKWGEMIENYLHGSKNLKTVFLLVDIRHEPSENDCMMHDWILANGMEPVIIATKKDKINRSQLQKTLNNIRTRLKVSAETPVLPFSALNKDGLEDIWKVISEQ